MTTDPNLTAIVSCVVAGMALVTAIINGVNQSKNQERQNKFQLKKESNDNDAKMRQEKSKQETEQFIKFNESVAEKLVDAHKKINNINREFLMFQVNAMNINYFISYEELNKKYMDIYEKIDEIKMIIAFEADEATDHLQKMEMAIIDAWPACVKMFENNKNQENVKENSDNFVYVDLKINEIRRESISISKIIKNKYISRRPSEVTSTK